jgi:8-oxo-dGTP diphosphatase
MARDIIMAAGGIVVRQGEVPLFAVVCLRKRGDWVLPKGKLDDGETPRAAAEREVLEETGHTAVVHDFLGTLAYPLGERTKVVHFWHMEAAPQPSRKLMKDISEVAWLPLDDALARLSRNHEYAFLAQVGPMALAATTTRSAPTIAAAPTVQRARPKSIFGTIRDWLGG